MDPLLSARNINKRIGFFAALSNIDLEIYPGEVVGLAGRSGAGKTLLTRILAGLLAPDEGEIVFNGRFLTWPFLSKKVGISLIHQKPMLADQFDIISNIFLGHEIKWSFLGKQTNVPNQRKMHREAKRILGLLDFRYTLLSEKVANLSSNDRQLISIAQGMAAPAKLRIVDDPTAVLSTHYQSRMLSLIESWQKQNLAVLYSSRNLDHLFAVTDRIIVLREGKLVANFKTDDANREEIVAALVGSGEQQQRTPAIWALDNYYQAKQQAEILRHNQQMLEKDLAARDSVNQELLIQLSKQVRALDSANVALQDAQRRLLTEREMERKRLARELHDETIQELLSLNYQLEENTRLAGGNDPLIAEMHDMRHIVQQMVTNIRGICRNLRPPAIDSLGLGAALKSYMVNWSDRTGIVMDLKLSENFARLPETIELSIFRIVQESLNNVWKHSDASQVRVSLEYTSPRMLSVTIADDGKGLPNDFDLSLVSDSGHFGLLGISERVALLGGSLQFANNPEGGLMIQAQIPHPKVTREDE